MKDSEKIINIQGVNIHLVEKDNYPVTWIGNKDAVRHLKAAWSVFSDNDQPMHPCIVGRPGVGKTTLAVHCAQNIFKQDCYIFQATMDTRPEDLIVTPVIDADNHIIYRASSLVTAMLRGGVCILDEGNRMNEKCWASLAPLLDDRHYVESIIAGVKINAHKDFRFCTTMNDDVSTYEIPEYIYSRIKPTIHIDLPDNKDLISILKFNVEVTDDEILEYASNYILNSPENINASIRDGINILRYSMKLIKSEGMHRDDAFARSLEKVLPDGSRY